MTILNPTSGVNAYVDTCCFNPNKEKFSNLLDDEVTLYHITNGEKTYIAKGKKPVLEIYEKYLFNITTNIMVESLKIKKGNSVNTASMKLIVQEDKKDYKGIPGISGWKFIDITEFTFIKQEDNSLKISEIFTNATAQLVNE